MAVPGSVTDLAARRPSARRPPSGRGARPPSGQASHPPTRDLTGLRRAIANRDTDELARQGHPLPVQERLVLAVAVIVGLAATYWSFAHRLPLLITDAQSHLVIAHRIIEGPNSGIGQVGTVWLPLPHLLLAPFTVSLFLWRTGLGAAFLGIGCLAVTCLATFRTAHRMTGTGIAGWSSVVVLLSTPTILYIHTTAMTEPVLLAAVSLTMAGVTGWEAKGWSYSGGEIMAFCGLGAFCVVLSRYEGWAFVAVLGLYAGVSVWRWKGLRAGMKAVRIFATAPAAAALLWLAFNALYFGDPFAFQRGEGSSEVQMAVRRSIGALPDYHRLGRSVSTYAWVTQAMCGRLLAVGGVVLMLAYAAGIGPRLRSRAPFAVLAMGAFHVLSLWSGQTFMSHEYAVRYGVVVIPVFALMAGWFAAWMADLVRAARKAVGPAWADSGLRSAPLAGAAAFIVVLAVVQLRTAYPTALLHEGRLEQQRTVGIDAAAKFVGSQPGGGRVLIDDTANPTLMQLGMPFARVVSSFSGPTWTTAMAGLPQTVARWALIDQATSGDRVAAALRKRPQGWTQVFRAGSAVVLRYDPTSDVGTSDVGTSFMSGGGAA